MASTVRVYRWDELALEKVTEMISRKVVSGARATLTQVYFKRGAMVPRHAHDSEQLTYVLQGRMEYVIDVEGVTVREGEVLHVPALTPHQAEALEDTFVLGVFSPPRHGWLDAAEEDTRA